MAGVSRKFCGHCMEMLASRTFREHQRLYFDSESNSWTKKIKRFPETSATEAAHEQPLITEFGDFSSNPVCPEEDNMVTNT